MNFHLVWDSMPGHLAMQPQIVERQNVQVLEIRLRRNALSGDSARADAAGRLFAFMLDALMKTLFPCSYMNMFTVAEAPEDPPGDTVRSGERGSGDRKYQKGLIHRAGAA